MQAAPTQTKLTIVDGMLWKYQNPNISIQGSQAIDFDSNLICFTLIEFDDFGEQITSSSDSYQTFTKGKDLSNIPFGLYQALSTMSLGEQAFFEINQYYKLSQQQILDQLDEQQQLQISYNNHFWLINIEKAFLNNLLTIKEFEELMLNINEVRIYAGQLFSKQCYQCSLSLYNLISNISTDSFSEDQQAIINIEISKSYSNSAICYLKLKDWFLTQQMCEKSLVYNERNEKAYFLLCRSKFELGKLEEAGEQFTNYKQSFPSKDCKEVDCYITKCQNQLNKLTPITVDQIYFNRKNEIEFDDII